MIRMAFSGERDVESTQIQREWQHVSEDSHRKDCVGVYKGGAD